MPLLQEKSTQASGYQSAATLAMCSATQGVFHLVCLLVFMPVAVFDQAVGENS